MSLNEYFVPMNAHRIAFWLLSTSLVISSAGCGESDPLKGVKAYPVKGKVTLPDGSPLTSGSVVFVATKSTITSTATIGSDGSFVFKGGANGDGLPEGDYKVRLEVGEGGRAKKGTTPFPSKYLDEDGSDLTATVKPDEGGNDFNLKLTANAPPRSAKSRGGQ